MIEEALVESAVKQFRDYKSLAERTFEQLEEKDFHFQPNETTNSIAITITHLHGNMRSRWTNLLTEDGEKEWRQRDDEFEVHDYNKQKLLQLWEEGWETVFNTLASLKPADLSATIHIRSKPLTVTDAIHRQLTHYAYHVGQIIVLGKIIKGENWHNLSIAKKK